MRINSLLKGIIGASIALALAGGAQASGQENASSTAPDKTQNDASTPNKSAAKAKAKKSTKKSTTTGSQGSSATGQSGQTGNSGTTGTMDNGTDTATDPARTGSAGTSGATGDTRSSGGVIDNRVRTTGKDESETTTIPGNNSGATPTNTGR
jgi:hypothetical protein